MSLRHRYLGQYFEFLRQVENGMYTVIILPTLKIFSIIVLYIYGIIGIPPGPQHYMIIKWFYIFNFYYITTSNNIVIKDTLKNVF